MDKILKKRAWIYRNKLIVILLTLIVLLIIYQLVWADHSSKLNVENDKIMIEKVVYGDYQDFTDFNGVAEPIRTAFLYAAENGRVDEILVEDGAMVKKGDVILKLSSPNLSLELSNSEVQSSKAINELRNAHVQAQVNKITAQRSLIEATYSLKTKKKEYENNSTLYKQSFIAKYEYEKSKDDYDAALQQYNLLMENQKQDSIIRKLQIQSLESSMNQIHANLEYVKQRRQNLVILATEDGEWVSGEFEKGQIINAGTLLGRINVIQEYKLKANIDEHYINQVYRGLNGNCEFASKNYSVKMAKIYPEVKSGNFSVDLVFDKEKPTAIRKGQNGRIRLDLGGSQKALLLPRGAFFQSTGGQWIYVLDQSKKIAYKRNIKIGRQNPKYYEVLEGLNANEKVIISGYETFGNVEKLILQ